MKNIILIIGLLISCTTFAGQEKGGGMVIKVQNRYSLFDFYENGLEHSAALSQRNSPDVWNLTGLLTVTLNDDSVLAHEIVNKLFDVYEKNIHLGYALYREFFSSYAIKIVNSELVETKDIGVSPVIPPAGSVIYQAAIRDDREKIVWINGQLWNKLSLEHKAGLIFHEAIYALFVLKRGDVSSSSSRALTAYIFDPSFDHQTPITFHQRLASYFRAFFLDSRPILLNSEAIELDLVNDFAKIKNEIFEIALFFDQYGKVWNERFYKEVKNLEATVCSKNKLPEFGNPLKYIEFWNTETVTFNDNTISPIVYGLDGVMKWQCLVKKGIFGNTDTIHGRIQIIRPEEMEQLKIQNIRLMEIKNRLSIGNRGGGNPNVREILLKNDPQFSDLFNWLTYPKSEMTLRAAFRNDELK